MVITKTCSLPEELVRRSASLATVINKNLDSDKALMAIHTGCSEPKPETDRDGALNSAG